MKPVSIYSGEDKPRTCPVCARVLDAFTGARHLDAPPDPPKPDDLTICAYCGSALMFTTVGLRVLTEDEIALLTPQLDETMRRVYQAFREATPFPRKRQARDPRKYRIATGKGSTSKSRLP